MADFTLDEDQRQIQETARRFADKELRPLARECDEKGEIPQPILDKAWELGFCPSVIPEEYGGYGLGRSILNTAIMAEELAWGDVSLALGALSPLLMMIPVLEFGEPDQKARWLPEFCGDNFVPATAALMEPRIAFSPFDLRTSVEKRGDQLVLNGKKCMVPMADRASRILIWASSAPGGGPGAVEAVMVDRETPGLIVGERESNMGLRPLPLFPVELKNCAVPLSNKIGAGSVDYLRMINLSRAVLSAMAVGVARASFQYSLDYARERYAFGEPIASRQSIAFMLAESAMEIDAMRMLAWRAAWRLDRSEDATRDASLAKSYAAREAMKVVDYGVQVLGGHGYIREHPVELWFRNGRAFSTLEGLAAA